MIEKNQTLSFAGFGSEYKSNMANILLNLILMNDFNLPSLPLFANKNIKRKISIASAHLNKQTSGRNIIQRIKQNKD